MPETSKGPGGRVKVGHRGDSFLKINFLVFLVVFLQTFDEKNLTVVISYTKVLVLMLRYVRLTI